MDDNRDLIMFCSQYNWYSNETALGEYNIWFITLHKGKCLKIALCNTERIRKILQIKVSAQFTGRDAVIRNTGSFDQLAFNTLIRTDITDFITCLL